MKDRRETEERILNAVTEIVREEGFTALGINSVSRRAGASKILVYRYFGSYEGLLEEWALRHSYWVEGTKDLEDMLSVAGSEEELVSLLRSLVGRQVLSLRDAKVKREVLRWLILERNKLTSEILRRIEDRGTFISGLFRSRLDVDEDAEAMIAILIAGLNYLTLMADVTSVFNGVSLKPEDESGRLVRAAERLVDMIFHTSKNGVRVSGKEGKR